MLVAWGLFVRELGLVQRLEQVPTLRRKRDNTPRTKLIDRKVVLALWQKGVLVFDGNLTAGHPSRLHHGDTALVSVDRVPG